jgi:hypothetical protein
MKNYLFLMIVGLCLLSFGCNYTGVPVEYVKMCDKENDDKYVEVVGFLDNTGSAMCTKRGKGPTECGIRFKDSLESEPWVFANIYKGGSASEIDAAEGEGLKIRDDKGDVIEREQKVKLTASVSVFSSPPSKDDKSMGCSLDVKKIEKAQ